MSWSTLVLDSKDGVRVLLTRLAGSPLVRKSLPNAAAICQQYFSFRRNTAESIGNFLVRETLVHEEFVEAIIRLHEQKEGVSQDQRDFGLPPASDDWDDDSWNGSWGWWNYDDEYPYEEGDDEGLPPVDSPGARGDGGPGPTSEGTPVAASPGSSPSHGHSTSGGRALTSTVGTQTNSATVVNEMSVTDSFIMGVLRGWRLLQAAGLSAEEKRDILGATKNSLDYDTIASALQNLWDDQLLAGHRHRGGGDHHFHMAEQTDYEGFYQDEWWPEEESWHDGYYVDGYGAEDEWWPDDWSGMEQQQAEAELEDNAEVSEKLKEAQKAEQVAESLAMEANRTWSEAHRAAQALRRDRGFGAVTATKGSGKCFNYGGNHFVRDCPSARFNGGYKGSKGKASAYVSDVFGDYYIGKGKGKGKSIGMDYLGAQGVGMMIDFATGPQHVWTSVLVGFNSAAVPHRDHHNLKDTLNLIHGIGDYEDGGLWLEGDPPNPGMPRVRRRLQDGSMAKGYVMPTRGQFVFFSPEQRHATQAWRGLRMTLSAYSTRSRPYMEDTTI